MDELTAYGVQHIRMLDFNDDTSKITFDRDLSPSEPDPAELIAIALPVGDMSSACGCNFVLAAACGVSSAEYDVVTGSFNVLSIGATEYRSVAALRKLPDWKEWRDAVRPGLHHAIEVKKGLTLRTHADFQRARRLYGDRHEILNLVTPCVVKHNADGAALRRKFRITAADVRGHVGSTITGQTY